MKDSFVETFITHATRDLASIMLMDTAHIQERDAEFDNKHLERKKNSAIQISSTQKVKPIYNAADVASWKLCFSSYDRWIDLVKESSWYLQMPDIFRICKCKSRNQYRR